MKRYPRKHRVTFRVATDLAAALRKIPNQTAFVESALRGALGRTCPLCAGSGRTPAVNLEISDFKRYGLPRIDRASALRLRSLVRLGRRVLASQLALSASPSGDLTFRLSKDADVLLEGDLS